MFIMCSGLLIGVVLVSLLWFDGIGGKGMCIFLVLVVISVKRLWVYSWCFLLSSVLVIRLILILYDWVLMWMICVVVLISLFFSVGVVKLICLYDVVMKGVWLWCEVVMNVILFMCVSVMLLNSVL